MNFLFLRRLFLFKVVASISKRVSAPNSVRAVRWSSMSGYFSRAVCSESYAVARIVAAPWSFSARACAKLKFPGGMS